MGVLLRIHSTTEKAESSYYCCVVSSSELHGVLGYDPNMLHWPVPFDSPIGDLVAS